MGITASSATITRSAHSSSADSNLSAREVFGRRHHPGIFTGSSWSIDIVEVRGVVLSESWWHGSFLSIFLFMHDLIIALVVPLVIRL
jgi:hypothetical protein